MTIFRDYYTMQTVTPMSTKQWIGRILISLGIGCIIGLIASLTTTGMIGIGVISALFCGLAIHATGDRVYIQNDECGSGWADEVVQKNYRQHRLPFHVTFIAITGSCCLVCLVQYMVFYH